MLSWSGNAKRSGTATSIAGWKRRSWRMALIPSPGGFIPSSLVDWLNGQDVERMNRYREMLDFYNGQQWERRRRAGETRLTANYARALVRKTASYVFSDPATYSVAPSEAQGISDELADR